MDTQLNILLIEDEAILAMGLVDILENANINVSGIANSGAQAIELFKNTPTDLILSDIHIKGPIDGIETVKQLLSYRPAPIVYLTSYSDRETVERAKQTFPAAYLSKPVNEHSLLLSIEMAINNFMPQQPQQQEAARPSLPDPREPILQVNNSIFIKQNYQFLKIELPDLLLIKADDSHITLYTLHRKYTLRLSLTAFLERLNFGPLVRVHRSFAVNINHVEAFTEHDLTVSQQTIPLTKGYKDDFLMRFMHR
jgi:two-component system, response regulator PdtaR